GGRFLRKSAQPLTFTLEGIAMSHELAILGTATTSVDGIGIDPLTRMKTPMSTSLEDDPFVGFTSSELGRTFIDIFGENSNFILFPFHSLTPEQIERISDKGIILFENPEQIWHYNRDRSGFNLSTHLVSLAEAIRRVQNAF
ncbi:MAG: hypothetical protein WAW10_12990, partial [Gallionella sp.]